MLHMFAIVFLSVFVCVSSAYFDCFRYFARMLQLFHLDVSKVDSRCCACCNVSHLPQLPTAAAGAPCMEGSGAAGVKGHGKCGGVARVGPACTCSRHWCGRCSNQVVYLLS